MGPSLPSRPKLYMLSEESIVKHVGGQSLGQLVYLNLHNCALRKVENLGGLSSLKVRGGRGGGPRSGQGGWGGGGEAEQPLRGYLVLV